MRYLIAPLIAMAKQWMDLKLTFRRSEMSARRLLIAAFCAMGRVSASQAQIITPAPSLSPTGHASQNTAMASGRGAGILGSGAHHSLNAIDDFGAYADAVSRNMLVTSVAGSTVVNFAKNATWPAPSFSAADVGKPIEIAGVGFGGAYVSTTISAVNSATQVVLAATIPTAVMSVPEQVFYGHDDTAALQAAFNAAAIQPVKVPCGTYRVTASLTTPWYSYITGSTVRQYYYSPGSAKMIPPPCSFLIGDGFRLSSSSLGFIQLGGYSHWEGIATSLQNGPAIPNIYGQYPWVELFHNFIYAGSVGIDYAYNARSVNQGWVIKDNDVSTASTCIRASSVYDFHITDNFLHGCGGYALDINSAGVGIVLGNTLEDSTDGGLRVAGDSGSISITANKFDGNYGANVFISGMTGNITFTGNFFDQTGAPGAGNGSWRFSGNSTGGIMSSGNIFSRGKVSGTYTFAGVGTFTLGPSAFYDIPAAFPGGLFDSSTTRAVIQPMMMLSPNNLPGPYANDSAAAAAGVPVGAEYKDSSGIRRQRVSRKTTYR